MSMGLEVYLVDEAEGRAVFGSNDPTLLETLLDPEGRGKTLNWLDYGLEDEIGDKCPGFTHADALRDIFAGRVTRPEAGFIYAKTFGHICSALGLWAHDRLHPCDLEDLRQLDELFAAHGVGLRFIGGLVDAPPVPLPAGQRLGHWAGAAVVAAAPAFRAMRAAGPHGEPWVEELLRAMGEWIAAVESRPGSMLVAVCG
jgi:hypothetical protein